MTPVVILSHSAARSGGELALARVAPILAKSLDLRVVCFEDGPLVEDLESAGLEVSVVPLDPAARELRRRGLGRSSFRAYRALLELAFRPALRSLVEGRALYSNSQKAHVVAGVLRATGHPGPWFVHQREYLSVNTLGVLPWVVAQTTAAASTQVIANSESTVRSIRLVRSSRKVVVSSPIDIDRFKAARGSRSSSGVLRVLMVGSLVPQKGADLLLHALSECSPSDRLQVRFAGAAHFGDDDYARHLQWEADQICRSNPHISIAFLGHVPEVPRLMADSDVLVAPSRGAEGMGQVIVQARAAGLPVIASDIPGYRDLVDPGVNGLLVPAGDHAALAAALRMVSDRTFLSRLGADSGGLEAFDDAVVSERLLRVLG